MDNDASATCPNKGPACASCETTCDQRLPQDGHIAVGRRILVMSGKGGVGKSSIAANLAVWLTLQDYNVGLLDIDIHGPSIPRLLGMDDVKLSQYDGLALPALFMGRLKVVSIGFMLSAPDTPVIWRGPAKHGVIEQFVRHVHWSALDYLIVDCPPGTGDEMLSVAQVLGGGCEALVVTTPQEIALLDVKKCIAFCRRMAIPVRGIVENMSGFVCPHCGRTTDIFSHGGGEALATETGAPLLGCIPLDPQVAVCSDAGRPVVLSAPDSPTAQALMHAFRTLSVGTHPKKPQGDPYEDCHPTV